MNIIMERHFALIGMIIMMLSCGKEEPGSRRPTSDENWRNPSFNIDSSANARKVCYMTGLDYPKDYDWRSDAQTGTVKCSLVVFADGVPAMKVPVGLEHHVSPDPDMHRIIKGHLYTDFSTDEETIIKKDGRELFRYSGRERILGMAVREGKIYTLGRPREGSGFTYRENGMSLIHKESGRAFPRLQEEEDALSFAFCESIEYNGGYIDRYYQVVNGNISQVAVREDILKVWDIIRHEGEVCYVAELTGVHAPVLIKGEKMKAMNITSDMRLVSCKMVPAGKAVGIEAIFSRSGLSWSSGLWKDGEKQTTFANGLTISGLCTDGESMCCILNQKGASGGGIIFRCGEILDMPAGYTCMGSSPMAMVDGILTIGLTSTREGSPIVWKDGRTQMVNINGCICTLTVE